jgi:hypothetical protein
MAIVGFILILGAVALAVAVAIITLWSGWRTFRDELLPGFRPVPPSPRSIALTVVGVVLPLLVIAVFTIYLAVTLLRLGVNAL